MDQNDARQKLVEAAVANVPFDGWSEATFRQAITDSGVEPGLARALFPRGGIDLALAYHKNGDREMVRALAKEDLGSLRFRDRIARAILLRLDLADREAVRRGTTLLTLPHHSAEGAKAIWGTADAIWTALGDTSEDINWYSKRASLSAVYSATVLFWLGDDSADQIDTREFLDRRIENVMQFEKAKAGFAANPLGRALLKGPLRLLDRVRAPRFAADLPGQTEERTADAALGRDTSPRPF